MILVPPAFARYAARSHAAIGPPRAAACVASADTCVHLCGAGGLALHERHARCDWAGCGRGSAAHSINRGTAAQRTACDRCTHPKGVVMQLVNFVKSFARNDEGQDLLEYALLVALIALVAVAAVTAAGSSVSTIFTSIAGKLTPAS